MTPRRSLRCATHFALCTYIEGVQFTFLNSAGKEARAVVLAEVLESRYGSPSDKAAWLEAFICNEAELVREARHLNAKATRALTIIMKSETQMLKGEGSPTFN